MERLNWLKRKIKKDSTEENQSESEKDRNSFVIRGHHLYFFASIMRANLSPEDAAANIRGAVEDKRKILLQGIFARKGRSYARDVIGKTKKEADLFEGNVVKVFEDFLELPDDYPIKLVIGQKDGICNACIVGEHCSLNDGRKFNGGKSISSDGLFVESFQQVALENNLESKISVSQETVIFSDTKPARVMFISTNAGVVRQVLKDDSFKKKTQLR